jgi:hypothetical protein
MKNHPIKKSPLISKSIWRPFTNSATMGRELKPLKSQKTLK